MSLLKSRYLRKPLVTGVAIAAVAAAAPVAWQLSAATATSSTLAGSNFESGDGNTAAGTGNVDWDNASTSSVHYLDTVDPPNPAASLPDNSFGQGAKEDIPNPNIVTGSIPPNKSDLTDFYTAYKTEVPDATGTNNTFTSNHTFLYLGWKRTKNLGNANMDFEFNQNPNQVYVNPSTGGTPARTAGDLLVTFDFPGSGQPVLSLFRWLTAANGDSKSNCYSASALPCWGNGTLGDLGANANGAVSSDGTFGEAGIDLTAAGVFSSSGCTTFGDAFMKSRSSSSFTSEIKDYVQLPPNSISVSNCGTINIFKTDDSGTDQSATTANSNTGTALSNVVFTLYNNKVVAGVDTIDTSSTTGVTGFTCTTGSAGTCTFKDSANKTGIRFGTYWIRETTYDTTAYTPAGDREVSLTEANSGTTYRFINNRNPAEIDLTKKDDAGNPLQGAQFSLYQDVAPLAPADGFTSNVSGQSMGTGDTQVVDGSNNPKYTCTSDTNGVCKIQNIDVAGTYWIVETAPPAGYTAERPFRITVALGTTYPNKNYSLPTFTDKRTFTIITLVCQDNTNTNLSGTVTPGLYGSKVYYDTQSAPSANNSITSVPTGLGTTTGSQLCSALGDSTSTANLAGTTTGGHTSSVNIPVTH